MASQTQGIQQLLSAERRAAEKVAEARKRKARRIKQAREEAQVEVENYRKERERLFREYEAIYMGSRDDAAAKIDKDTVVIFEQMEKDIENHKDAVVEGLMDLVLNLQPKVHPNYKLLRHFGKI